MNVAETALPTRGHNRPRNPGAPLAPDWFESVGVNASAVERRAATLTTRRSVKKEWQAAWLVKAMTCIDLTTLSGDDTPGRVRQLCAKASRPKPDGRGGLRLPDHGGARGQGAQGLCHSRSPPSRSAFPPAYLALRLDEFGGFVSSARKPSPARENRFVRDAAIESPRLIRMSSEQGSSLGRFVPRPSRGGPRELLASDDRDDLGRGGRRPRRRSQDSDNIAR